MEKKIKRKELILITVITLLGVLFAVASTFATSALAKGESNEVTITCEPGVQIINLENGKVKIIGDCTNIKNECPETRDTDNTIVYSPYDESYPEPENRGYPAPEGECDIIWSLLGQCEE